MGLQHDMVHKIVQLIEEQKVERQLEEELVTILNQVVAHVHRTTNRVLDVHRLLEAQVQDLQNTVRLKVLQRIEKVLQEALRVLQVHTNLQDHLHHVRLDLFALLDLHQDHLVVVVVQAEVQVEVLAEDKLLLNSGY
jgi:methylphosphotriester-DNA--protein-cysteine methyltransferase